MDRIDFYELPNINYLLIQDDKRLYLFADVSSIEFMAVVSIGLNMGYHIKEDHNTWDVAYKHVISHYKFSICEYSDL